MLVKGPHFDNVEEEDPKTLTGLWFIEWMGSEKIVVSAGQVVRQLLPDVYLLARWEEHDRERIGRHGSMHIQAVVDMLADYTFYDTEYDVEAAYRSLFPDE